MPSLSHYGCFVCVALVIVGVVVLLRRPRRHRRPRRPRRPRHRPRHRTPRQETREENGRRLKRCCEEVNKTCDVEGLCQGYPKCVKLLQQKQGGRLKK